MTPSQRTVVVAGGAGDAPPGHAQPDLTVCFDGDRRNVALDLDRITAELPGAIPSRLRDFLEIALAVYSADLAFARGRNEDWVRSTSFLVPVRDPDFWSSVEPQLARFLYVLCKDAYVFGFCAREAEDEASDGVSAPEVEADCVSLLSGGLDSFAGAAVLLAAGRKTVFVAHRPHNATVAASQTHVHGCLTRRFGEGARLVAVPCGPARAADTSHPFPPPDERETSQRARSFLYLTLGAVACHLAGARELVCPENGLLAANLPLTEARVGGQSTAGTRPQTLSAFSELVAALGLDIAVANPFVYHTKGELVRDVLSQHFGIEEIQGAVSCWMAGRMSRPCGACIPCMVRAVSMDAAGLPKEAHMRDPLGTGGLTAPDTAARANLVDLITFVRRFSSQTDTELLMAYPGLLDLAPHVNPVAAIKTLRRFATETRGALDLPGVVGD